jgi:hypothetical protein
MAIKARPYGRKPGIAVAKETSPCLLALRTLVLRWALASVVALKESTPKNMNTDFSILKHYDGAGYIVISVCKVLCNVSL